MPMDSELLARISPSHQHRLAWFEEHQGEVSRFPSEERTGLLLTGKAKGIFKPADLTYALSIRINRGSSYEDGAPIQAPGGGWRLSYYQEGADPSARDRLSGNRGLMNCIADRVPVGVLREIAPINQGSQYEVLGLAQPVTWEAGFFFLESIEPPPTPTANIVSAVLEATARAELDDTEPPVPADDYDARMRAIRQIVARQGQSAFRADVMAAYRGRCAVTGCDVPAALEAAHLLPYRGPESNTVANGLLLRADIHNLLDLQLLAFDPSTRRVVLSKQLAGTHYEALSGTSLATPGEQSQRPSQDALERAWLTFVDGEGPD